MMEGEKAFRGGSGGLVPMRWGAAGVSAPDAEFALPTGTVTFLLTDVAGSTRMWETEPDDVMRSAIVRHYEILAEVVDAHGGVRPQEQGEGDSIVAAFARPSDALAAACAAQQALAAELWTTSEPVRVRMAVHTGEAQLRDNTNYAGQAIIRTARLRAVGHGGQVLVSGATRDLAVDQTGERLELRSLGEHRLRDLGRPEHVWQLVIPDLDYEFEPLATIDAVPNSLPVSLSPFIGRDAEVAELARLVCGERLVTATGTGGAGKTRLAQQVGAELIEGFPAGVWWVELAPLDVDGVEPAVRAAFGISEGATLPLAESVARLLGDRRCLLIVDNCEHVTDRVAPLIHDLLTAAPTLHVLATSRVMLDLPGEQAWRVPALGLPEPGATVPLDALSQYDAVRLFCDRARRARPNFELTTANGATVAEICHRLGAIPLAIELAAARTRMLDPQRILDGLDDAVRILAGGSKALMARQQTLDASIAWSYDLLTPTEQTLLRRLSVFVDGWTLDTAEAICPDPGSGTDSTLDRYHVFDALDRLVDHSLIHAIDTPTGVRFGMLETVRQYAARRLTDHNDDATATRRRHAVHFTAWASSLRDDLLGRADEDLFDHIDAEKANLLAAVAATIDDGRPEEALGALVAFAPCLEYTMWAPAVTTLLALLDRIEANVDSSATWRVLLVRQHVTVLLGDPVGELGLLAQMEAAAESAGQPLGVLIARCTSLAIMGIADVDALAGCGQAIADLERLDAGWAWLSRLSLTIVAGYQGQLSVVDRVMERPDVDLLGRVARSALGLAEGIAMWSRGDALNARRTLLGVLAAPHRHRSVATLAEGFLALAEVDLGVADTGAAELRMMRSYEIEGNALGRLNADWLRAVRLLGEDDLDGADTAYRAALESSLALGLADFGPNERYALVAADRDGYEASIETVGALVTGASNLRAQAEQALRRGEVAGALSLAHDALARANLEHLYRSMLYTLECISRILVAAGRHVEGTTVHGACAAFRAEHSLSLYPCLQRLLDDAALTSRVALGDDAYDTALADGSTLSLDAAVEYATRLRVAIRTKTVGWDALTPTEARVAELVAEGLTNPQVAKELLMGPETVKTHLSRVFAKLGVANRKELIVAASRRAAERHR